MSSRLQARENSSACRNDLLTKLVEAPRKGLRGASTFVRGYRQYARAMAKMEKFNLLC